VAYEIDNEIIPQRSAFQFLRGPVMIADMNTWGTSIVGPHSFSAKFAVGRARPEVSLTICMWHVGVKLMMKLFFIIIVNSSMFYLHTLISTICCYKGNCLVDQDGGHT